MITIGTIPKKLQRFFKPVMQQIALDLLRSLLDRKVLRLEPVSKLKQRMSQMVWLENVKDVIKYSHEKPVIRRLEKLLTA